MDIRLESGLLDCFLESSCVLSLAYAVGAERFFVNCILRKEF